jgi:DNA-directed RNA polymerase subunit omega
MPLDNISELKRRVPGGKYVLTRAVAKRAQQLQEGSPPLMPVRIANPLSVAIDEIVAGKISFDISEQTEEALAAEAAAAAPVAAEEAPISTDDILRVEPQEESIAEDEGEGSTAEAATSA